MMKYKRYFANVEYHPDDKIFFGKVIGIRDTITFQGTSVAEIEKEFRISVDEYLRMCKDLGRRPSKPYSGKLVVRMNANLHAALAQTA